MILNENVINEPVEKERIEILESVIDKQEQKKHEVEKKVDDNPLRIQFLGGVRELGRNATLYTYKNESILLDCGSAFDSPDKAGYRYELPDLNVLVNKISELKGIFITHGHEDHIGAIVHLLRRIRKIVPIYAGRFPLELIKETLSKEKDPFFEQQIKFIFPVRENNSINIGAFSLRFVTVTHSIPDAFFVFIKTEKGVVLHTGDWKFDITPIGRKTNFGDIIRNSGKGVDLVLCDSTRANEPGCTETEKVVVDAFEKLFSSNTQKRIVAVSFSSNVNRVVKLISIAQQLGRKVFLLGHGMVKSTTAAVKSGLVKTSNLWRNSDRINSFAPGKVFVLCTGTQGEKQSSLYRIATDSHQYFKADSRDVFAFTSNIIPGNEQSVFYCINLLLEKGAEVVHRMLNSAYNNFHVSGHPSSLEIKMLCNLVRPKYFIPVHGEYFHMYSNKRNALACGINEKNILLPSNGDEIQYDGKVCTIAQHHKFNGILLDENLHQINESTIEKRRQFLMFGAFIFIFHRSNNKIKFLSMKTILTSDVMNSLRISIEKFLKEKLQDFQGEDEQAISSKLLTLLCSFLKCTHECLPLYRCLII